MEPRAPRSSAGRLTQERRKARVAQGRPSQAWRTEALEGRLLLAGTPELLANVNAGTRPSNPGQFTQVGSTVFFAASNSAIERELWRTDGTAAGTMLVKDIRPG